MTIMISEVCERIRKIKRYLSITVVMMGLILVFQVAIFTKLFFH